MFDDVTLILNAPRDLRGVISLGWYSPSYGVRVPCAVLDFDIVATIDGRREYAFQIES
jgi:hypothetical protein